MILRVRLLLVDRRASLEQANRRDEIREIPAQEARSRVRARYGEPLRPVAMAIGPTHLGRIEVRPTSGVSGALLLLVLRVLGATHRHGRPLASGATSLQTAVRTVSRATAHRIGRQFAETCRVVLVARTCGPTRVTAQRTCSGLAARARRERSESMAIANPLTTLRESDPMPVGLMRERRVIARRRRHAREIAVLVRAPSR